MNYAIKGDDSQYQRVIRAAFVWKAYEKAIHQNIEEDLSQSVRTANIGKFALHAFNRLAYDWEIRGLLAANTLLTLPEYYTPEKTIRKVNLWAIYERFSRTISSRSVDEDVVKILYSLENRGGCQLVYLMIIIREVLGWHDFLFMII